jgi:hypothetical protein
VSKLHRTSTPERRSATCKPNTSRRHLRLQDATGQHQTYPYTMYRPRSVDSPTSRRRSGRRRRRNPRIDGERGGETRVAQKFLWTGERETAKVRISCYSRES